MPDNEPSTKIDTAIGEAIRQFEQRIKALDAEVERINANNDPASIIEATGAVRQLIKDLEAAVRRIREATRGEH